RTTSNTTAINQGFNLSANNNAADNVQLSETINFTNTDGNLVSTVNDNEIVYNLAEAIDLGAAGSLTTGNTTVNNTGVRIDDGTNISSYGANGFTVTDGINSTALNQAGLSFTDVNGAIGPSITATGLNAGGTVITNVGEGVAATDAATKGQVDAAAAAGNAITAAL
ncbi:hypothetical protein, partial [Psychrobacter sp. ASPA161_6]|uniref:hypothetical protein n=1 Tax=Psychrobacter sp. ASPA161_6 TaxID=3160962 RepID=UPI003F810935